MTLDELIVRIRVAADGSSEELDGLMDELRAFAAQAQKSGGQVEKATMNTAAAWACLLYTSRSGATDQNQGTLVPGGTAHAASAVLRVSCAKGYGGIECGKGADHVFQVVAG